jgi:hypothetical protein
MVRALTLSVSLALLLAVASPASAVPVSPVDLATLTPGAPVGSILIDDFTSGAGSAGEAATEVFFDGVTYLYTQTVTPDNDFNFVFNTDFAAGGFTGVAGWRYTDAATVGANGDGSDFRIENVSGQLVWMATLGGAFGEWNAFEPITFFFASTRPPTIKNYSLFSLLPVELGTAQGLAPLPEPGSIALFGSGLVGLYAALKRRRNLTM